jgi:hypothetical protein
MGSNQRKHARPSRLALRSEVRGAGGIFPRAFHGPSKNGGHRARRPPPTGLGPPPPPLRKGKESRERRQEPGPGACIGMPWAWLPAGGGRENARYGIGFGRRSEGRHVRWMRAAARTVVSAGFVVAWAFTVLVRPRERCVCRQGGRFRNPAWMRECALVPTRPAARGRYRRCSPRSPAAAVRARRAGVAGRRTRAVPARATAGRCVASMCLR